jgi:hypothetical protein
MLTLLRDQTTNLDYDKNWYFDCASGMNGGFPPHLRRAKKATLTVNGKCPTLWIRKVCPLLVHTNGNKNGTKYKHDASTSTSTTTTCW